MGEELHVMGCGHHSTSGSYFREEHRRAAAKVFAGYLAALLFWFASSSAYAADSGADDDHRLFFYNDTYISQFRPSKPNYFVAGCDACNSLAWDANRILDKIEDLKAIIRKVLLEHNRIMKEALKLKKQQDVIKERIDTLVKKVDGVFTEGSKEYKDYKTLTHKSDELGRKAAQLESQARMLSDMYQGAKGSKIRKQLFSAKEKLADVLSKLGRCENENCGGSVDIPNGKPKRLRPMTQPCPMCANLVDKYNGIIGPLYDAELRLYRMREHLKGLSRKISHKFKVGIGGAARQDLINERNRLHDFTIPKWEHDVQNLIRKENRLFASIEECERKCNSKPLLKLPEPHDLTAMVTREKGTPPVLELPEPHDLLATVSREKGEPPVLELPEPHDLLATVSREKGVPPKLVLPEPHDLLATVSREKGVPPKLVLPEPHSLTAIVTRKQGETPPPPLDGEASINWQGPWVYFSGADIAPTEVDMQIIRIVANGKIKDGKFTLTVSRVDAWNRPSLESCQREAAALDKIDPKNRKCMKPKVGDILFIGDRSEDNINVSYTGKFYLRRDEYTVYGANISCGDLKLLGEIHLENQGSMLQEKRIEGTDLASNTDVTLNENCSVKKLVYFQGKGYQPTWLLEGSDVEKSTWKFLLSSQISRPHRSLAIPGRQMPVPDIQIIPLRRQ